MHFKVAATSISDFGNEKKNHCLRFKNCTRFLADFYRWNSLDQLFFFAKNCKVHIEQQLFVRPWAWTGVMHVICFEVYCLLHNFICMQSVFFGLQLSLMVLIGFILSNGISRRKLQTNWWNKGWQMINNRGLNKCWLIQNFASIDHNCSRIDRSRIKV